jgi:hypothetical protein
MIPSIKGVVQGAFMDSLKYRWGRPCPTTLRPASGHYRNGLTTVSGMVALRAGDLRPTYYPLGYPMPLVSGPNPLVRNFPCQTLKISKVSIVVMGSQRYALRAASHRPAYRPPGVWPPAGRNWCFLVTYLNIWYRCIQFLLQCDKKKVRYIYYYLKNYH